MLVKPETLFLHPYFQNCKYSHASKLFAYLYSFTQCAKGGRYINKIKRMTPVLTTAIIIKGLSFGVIMQQNVLESECSFYIRTKQNNKAYLYDKRRKQNIIIMYSKM